MPNKSETAARLTLPPEVIVNLPSELRATVYAVSEDRWNQAVLIAAAEEIERLRGLLIHYGDMAGAPEDEMRKVCNL